MASSTVTMTAISSKKPFICDWPGCGQAYVRRSILRNHIAAKHRQLRHPCSLCSQDFCYRNDLTQHQKRVHEKQRPYVCTINDSTPLGCACGRDFATSSELYRHQRAYRTRSAHRQEHSRRVLSTQTAADSRLCRAPAQSGQLDGLEHTLVAVHGYVIGSFQCGRWYVDDDGREWSSMNHKFRLFGPVGMLEIVVGALRSRHYDLASIQLHRLCQVVQEAMTVEDPRTMFTCVLQGRKVIDDTGTPHLTSSYKLLVNFMKAISISMLGKSHPWTWAMHSLADSLDSGTFKEEIFILTRALRAAIAEATGINGAMTVYFDLELTKFEDDPVSHLRQILHRLVGAYGVSHALVGVCVGRLLDKLWDQEGPAMVEKELELASLPIETSQMSRILNARASRVAWWRYNLARAACDWHRASVILANDVIPMLSSPNSGRYDLQLEEALEKSGQLDRLERARARRYSDIRRLSREVAHADQVLEKSWLNNKAMEVIYSKS